MRSGVVCYVDPGKVIPDDFILKAAETHPIAVACAAVVGDAVVTHVSKPEHSIEDTVEKFQSQAEFKDHKRYFHFTQMEDDFDGEAFVESLQPFNLIQTDDGKVLLSVLAEGEFPNFKGDGKHTAEYNFINEFFADKVLAAYAQTGSNLDKVLQILDEPNFRAEVQKHLEPRGSIVVIPASGKAFAYSLNSLGGKFDWGYASKTLGFTPLQHQPAPKTENKKPMSYGDKRKAALAAAKGEGVEPKPEPVVEPDKPGTGPQPEIKEPPVEEPVVVQGVSTARTALKNGVMWVFPPPGMKGWDDQKKWWNRHCHLSRPKDPVGVLAGFPAANLKADSPIRSFLPPATAIGDALQKAKGETKVAETPVDKQQHVKEGPLLVPAEEKKALVDRHKAGQLDMVLQIADVEKEKIPKFSAEIAIPVEEIARWKISEYFKLDKRSLTLMANEFRLLLLAKNPDWFKKPETKAEEPAKPKSYADIIRERKASKAAA